MLKTVKTDNVETASDNSFDIGKKYNSKLYRADKLLFCFIFIDDNFNIS